MGQFDESMGRGMGRGAIHLDEPRGGQVAGFPNEPPGEFGRGLVAGVVVVALDDGNPGHVEAGVSWVMREVSSCRGNVTQGSCQYQ